MSKTFYVIRNGWNAANQSSVSGRRNPATTFDSRLDCLVAIVEAPDKDAALEEAVRRGVTVYHNQFLWATTNPRALRGLTKAIREFDPIEVS